jgi:hypothetical protein
MKIAREEQKLIKAQRQLESIRLLDELFDRIKVNNKEHMTRILYDFNKKNIYEHTNDVYNFIIVDKSREKRN